MGFRVHIFYFQTAVNVPLWNIVVTHGLLHLLGEELWSLTLTGYLHYLKGKVGINAVIDKICHDTVTAADNVRNCAYAVFDKVLRIAQPYVRTVGKSRDLEQVGEFCGLCIKKHLHGKSRTHLRDSKGSCLPADILSGNAQCCGRLIKAHYLFVRRENILCHNACHVFKMLVKCGHIVSKLVKLQDSIME